MSLKDFIRQIPKAELHLHIEGSFEPELMFEIARRNNINIPYNSIEEVKQAYEFNNLQEFLDIYYAGANVLQTEQDFYDLTWAYLTKIHRQNVVHTEIFFDPQTHTERGIAFDTVFNGILRALQDGQTKLSISYNIIMCFLRHLSQAQAIDTLQQALPYKQHIIGIGLDSSEVGHPPAKFEQVFKQAQSEGFLTVAHAGEEGPSEYIWEAIRLLNVKRIDHGNRCLDDDNLVDYIARHKIPLTLCPLSNLKLKVVPDLSNHPVKKLLQKGIVATINSDDPAYFGGYINENFEALADAVNLTENDIITLVKNSFKASFISNEMKQQYLALVDDFVQQYRVN